MSTVGLKRNHHNIVGAARAGALEQIRDVGVCVCGMGVWGGGFIPRPTTQHNTTTTTTTEIKKRKENGDGRGDFLRPPP